MATPNSTGSNYSTLQQLFKERYDTRPVQDLGFDDKPLLGLMPTTTDLGGANVGTDQAYRIPLLVARPPAISGSLTVAQTRAGQTSSTVEAWSITTSSLFGVVHIDNESWERSQGRENAFVDIKMLEAEKVEEAMLHVLHTFLYGDGSGTLAQAGSVTQQASFSTSVLQLLDPETSTHIEVGFELTAAQAETTGNERALGTNGHGLYVIGIDRDKGTITVGTASGAAVNLNDTADGIPTIDNNDYLFLRGTRNSCITGVTGFIPQVAPTTGSLFGVPQYVDATRLAGSRFDASNYGIEEGILRAVSKTSRNNGRVKQTFLQYKHFADFAMAMVNKGIAEMTELAKDDTSVGYEALKVIGARGVVDIVPDHACPATLGFATDIDKWTMLSVGDLVHVLNTQVQTGGMIVNPTADGWEIRFGSYAQPVPLSPKDNCNILLPSAA